ncbi:uncharacterized protein LAESUDRAFT_730448 [Laetiporus sulphureus 93-53]|uniref:Formin GTPase-binding domain-containing protein n=1 Tax=Laetiporus sulphureus 93-53 TaxID=1314785 RepID=A0A165C5Z2_9APHY|nr:uncharacterized protein LAESUDRAFT_730448 [Laetiporus sulphureus 93-53]KZT02263.1 hypothetical protein LAESUDRAFT_730448 [Laetiporus sulphureus 93-53]
MFKSILPSRRSISGEFQMVTGPGETAPNGKENFPSEPSSSDAQPSRTEKKKKRKSKDPTREEQVDPEEFDKLLDELQVPDNMRGKLATMDMSVKAAFLKSSRDMATMRQSQSNSHHSLRGPRRAYSSDSLSSLSKSQATFSPPAEESSLPRSPDRPRFMSSISRGVSIDVGRHPFLHTSELTASVVRLPITKEKRAKHAIATPAKWCKILTSVSTVQLEVETVKKLRLLLRNEPTQWTKEFLKEGGYPALLSRLDEILNVEWREEQHDDQILHELLRCIKALSTSSVGCAALRSQCPEPYTRLVTLLYSDKRPGEVGTRQLIIELLLILFDLYPPSSLPSIGSPKAASMINLSRSAPMPWQSTATLVTPSNLIVLPAPHSSLFSFLKSLLLTPAPRPAEADSPPVEPHKFIEELHRPRIYKTYLEELNNICRDYFWVFCHPNNTIWILGEVDEGKVEKPRAPGGMTGGVEFEAMTYMTIHFKFLNALARAAEDLRLDRRLEHSAFQLHSDLFASGLEKILFMSRKASATYYPTLHLEIARYVAAAGRSGYELPWNISRVMGSPPSAMRKPPAPPPRAPKPLSTHSKSASMSAYAGPSTPTRGSFLTTSTPAPTPALPPVRKVNPMFGC